MKKDELIENIDKLLNQAKVIKGAFLYNYCYSFLEKQFGEEELKEYKQFGEINFSDEYQTWYSKVLTLIKSITPERKEEFERLYMPAVNRKDLTLLNYTIFDAIRGLKNPNKHIQTTAAINLLNTQISILKGMREVVVERINNIQNLLEFDVFEKEIDSARYLLRNKYFRSAGAICGVILEKHLTNQLNIKNCNCSKKNPTLGDLIDCLHLNKLISTTQYKYLIYLADIRNKCDHNKSEEPTKEDVQELINGTDKVIKTYN